MNNVPYDRGHFATRLIRRTSAVFWLGLAFGVGSPIRTAVRAQPPPVVAIVAVTCVEYSNSGEIEVQGEVKNISSLPVKSLEMSAVFSGPSGQFVSTSDLLAKFDPVMPGQVSPFDGLGEYNPVIQTVKITPALMFGPALPFSGNGEAQCVRSEQ